MALLYQEIMKVPGLTGTWQQRNRQLYEKLGSPMGPYTGSYDQNAHLLKQIQANNYYASGTPGSAPGGTTNTPQQTIFDQNAGNIKPNPDIYSQDVMTQNQWFDPFDEWTRNFVDTYMRPEWERDTYNPQMKQMTQGLNDTNQKMGATNSWRTGTATKGLADMAKEMITEEERMRQQFQEQGLAMRDQIRTSLAVPLYKSNMTRWGDAPWRDMNVGDLDVGAAVSGAGIQGDALTDLLEQLPTWTPNKADPPKVRDWTVKPDSPYSPGLFGQYTNRRY